MPRHIYVSLSRGLVLTSGVLLLGAAAHGSVILESGGWRAEVDDNFSSDADLFVDFVSQDRGVIVLEKFAQFRHLNELTGRPDPINITFTQIADDANTVGRIALNDEAATNLTGVDWNGFEMALLDSGDATFNQALSSGFSINPFTTASYNGASTTVTFSGGTVPSGTTWFPGTASGNLVIDVNLSQQDPVVFTLKELPLPVPAPGVGALAVCALGFVSRRRR